MIGRHPLHYLRQAGLAHLHFWLPPSEHPFLYRNRARIYQVARFYNALFYGARRQNLDIRLVAGPAPLPYLCHHLGWLWLLLTLVATGHGLVTSRRVWSRFRERGSAMELPSVATAQVAQAVLLLFVVFNIGYVTLAANAFELGENNRMRMLVEPLFILLVAHLLNRASRSLKQLVWCRLAAKL